MDYQQKALDFLQKTQTKFNAELVRYDYYFDGDTDKRNIYKVTLSNKKHSYTFEYGASIMSGDCTEYDVLACLTKYDPETFDDFISTYGYEIDSKESYERTEQTYKAVQKEYANVKQLFTDEQIEELSEIE